MTYSVINQGKRLIFEKNEITLRILQNTRVSNRFASIYYTCNSRCTARTHFRFGIYKDCAKETGNKSHCSTEKVPRKITSSRCRESLVNDSHRRGGGNNSSTRLSEPVGRPRGQIRKARSRRSEWRLRHPPGSYRSLRHMASLDARERVSLSSLGRSFTHTRSYRRRVRIILRVTHMSTVTPRLTIFKNARPITTGENRLRTRCCSASVLS